MGVSALCPLLHHIQRRVDPAPGLINSNDLLDVQNYSPGDRAKAQGDRERTGMLGDASGMFHSQGTIMGGSKQSWDWGSKRILL